MKPAFYLRVSTAAQDFPSQLLALQERCRREGWPVPGKDATFAEKASGARATRGQLNELLKACRDGKFDTILTYRADRLGRSFQHMVNLYQELRDIKVRVVSIADSVDTDNDTPATRALFRTLATAAEMHREIIVENTRAGLASARKAGKRLGRPQNRRNDAKLERAKKLIAKGASLYAAAKKTGLDRGYLWRALKGEFRKTK